MSSHVHFALTASDEEVGPACSNVPCPPTIATDDAFREAYCQGYRHALADAREYMRTITSEDANDA